MGGQHVETGRRTQAQKWKNFYALTAMQLAQFRTGNFESLARSEERPHAVAMDGKKPMSDERS
jgi:hypothetical protein